MTKDEFKFSMYMVIFLVLTLGSCIYFISRNKKEHKLTSEEEKKVRTAIINMSPREFEIFCSNLYELKGYRALITSSSNDGGKDIILSKHGKKYYVECKCYRGSIVGRPIAQKLAGALIGDGISPKNGIIITSSKFSKGCINYCKEVGIVCHDINDIINIINKIPIKIRKTIFKI